MIISNGKVLTPAGFKENVSIKIEKGKILKIDSVQSIKPEKNEPIIDAKGLTVSPGFIDLHCHGGNGADIMDGDYADVTTVARYHATCGTTAFFATTCCDSLEHIMASLFAIEKAARYGTGGAQILGAHMEGPYFSPKNVGCHLPKYVRNPDPDELEEFFKYSGLIKHMTIAPEIAGALELIKKNKELGITSSAGHTVAAYEDMMAAIDAGATHSTHLYNAMSSAQKKGPKKYPGVAEISLADDRLTTEIVADGKHVPDEMMKIAYRSKGADKLCLVTDAMRAAGRPAGEIYTFGGLEGTPAKIVDDVAVMLDDSGYASSTAGMDRLVRTIVQRGVAPLDDALIMASATPAKVAKVIKNKGTIEVGKDADFTILDKDLNIKYTIALGEIVYKG